MKTLLLMRHAKSSWKDHSLTDLQRPLKKRGHKDARRMADLLKDHELIPQKIYASPAQRARETVAEIVERCSYTGEVDYNTALYMPEISQVLELLRNLPADLERVLLISHNPGLESAVQILSGHIESLPTAGIAHISLPIKEWSELSDETRGDLVDLYRPRDLK